MKIVAIRSDAFGERMCALLNAIVIANKLSLEFKFAWFTNLFVDSTIHGMNDILTPVKGLPGLYDIFDASFIEQYYDSNIKFIPHEMFPDISILKNKKINNWVNYINYNWGDYFYYQGYLSELFDYNYDEYKKDLKLAWKSIKFSDRYNYIISKANDVFYNLGDFISIHIRTADIVYSKSGKTIYISHLKTIPFHLAAYIISNSKYSKVLVFSDDLNSAIELKKQLISLHINTHIIDDFIHLEDFNTAERTFFEIILMSKSLKNYSTGFSGFSRLANFISDGENCNIYKYYNTNELYNMLYNGILKFNFNRQQTAMSFFILYLYSDWLNYDVEKQEYFLNNAINLYNECVILKLFYIYTLLKSKRYNLLFEFLNFMSNLEINELIEILINDMESRTYNFMYFYFISNYSIHFSIFEISKRIVLKIIDINYSIDSKTKEAIYNFITKNETFGRQELIFGSAKMIIFNHLSYKLGQAMIINSKSFLGYLRMPFVLSYIKDKHNQEQKIYKEKIKKDPSLKLPPLESYPDYKEALKEKECLTYKLGQAFIKANKTWYKGGYIKLWFEITKLKKEFKKEQYK